MPVLFHDDGQVALWHGDVREVLRGLPAESVHCVVTSPPLAPIESHALESQLLHCSDRLGRDTLFRSLSSGTPLVGDDVHLTGRNTRRSLQCPQLQEQDGLLSFDPQVWQKRLGRRGGIAISHNPRVKRPAVRGARFLNAPVAAESLVKQVDGFGRDLLTADFLREHWVPSISANALVVRRPLNAQVAIAIDYTCQVGQCEVIHV